MTKSDWLERGRCYGRRIKEYTAIPLYKLVITKSDLTNILKELTMKPSSQKTLKRRGPGILPLAMWLLVACVARMATANVVVSVATDRADAVYAKNDPIHFNIKVLSDDAPAAGSVNYVISNDGAQTLKSGALDLQDGAAGVLYTQAAPMIVRCTVSFTPAGEKPVSGMAAAAVAPFEIQPTATMPDDFEAYWNAQKAELAKVPMNAQLTPVAVKTPGVEVYDITLDNVNGAHVHGYFGKPKGDGPFPAILQIPGAAVAPASKGYAEVMAARGFLAMAISVHDLPNDQSPEFYKEQYAGALRAYYLQGRENRDTYYFHRTIIGNVRAIDFLTSQPNWDKQHMIVNGSSQGGGMTLITTGLDARVTAGAANVPALCDHSGRNFGRPSGWPQLAPPGTDGKLDPEILQVSRYYDAVNFARRIKVPLVFGVGLIDTTCPPTTVFSAYNVVQSPKKIDIAPLMAHSFSPAFNKMSDAFITEQAGK
jgi:cephalosporin-C deacetylase-like acetyl esterase